MLYHNFLAKNDYEILGISGSRKFNSETKIIDVQNIESLISIIEKFRPNFVINAIGILISESKKNLKKAIFLNAFFPHFLNEISLKKNFKLIHISTDCVFSGLKGGYLENDFKDGKSNYAKTKGLGEIINNYNLTVRTSIVGPELKSEGEELFNWFMKQNKPIYGYLNAYWSGVTSIELFKFISFAIENKITGLYHLTNGIKINKNDLLTLFNKSLKRECKIKPFENDFNDKSFIDSRLIYPSPPSYEIMIKDMANFIKNNIEMYPHYILK